MRNSNPSKQEVAADISLSRVGQDLCPRACSCKPSNKSHRGNHVYSARYNVRMAIGNRVLTLPKVVSGVFSCCFRDMYFEILNIFTRRKLEGRA